MMKTYHLYVFTQDNCEPCTKLKEHVKTLTNAEQAELDFVPIKTPSGQRTALAEELSVDLTPTLVVTHEQIECRIEADGFEDCDFEEESVERIVGSKAIIEHLQATLDAYTYAHPD